MPNPSCHSRSCCRGRRPRRRAHSRRHQSRRDATVGQAFRFECSKSTLRMDLCSACPIEVVSEQARGLYKILICNGTQDRQVFFGLSLALRPFGGLPILPELSLQIHSPHRLRDEPILAPGSQGLVKLVVGFEQFNGVMVLNPPSTTRCCSLRSSSDVAASTLKDGLRMPIGLMA